MGEPQSTVRPLTKCCARPTLTVPCLRTVTISPDSFLPPSTAPGPRRETIAEDIVIQVEEQWSSELDLPSAELTKLLVAGMVTFYHLAAQAGNGRLEPGTTLRSYSDALELIIMPGVEHEMQPSDAFFALEWIYIYMAVPNSAFRNPSSGFKQRAYNVYRREHGGRHLWLGLINFGFRSPAQERYEFVTCAVNSFLYCG